MPNHVHGLIRFSDKARTGDVIRSWKTISAPQINKRLDRRGVLWAKDYHDRYIRDEMHFQNVARYIRNNPVKAGLCAAPADWPWSSATRT